MAERKHIYNLVMVMAIGGVLGGIGNYFLLPTNASGSFWRSLFLGVVAAGVLPLFLKMISSNLIDYEGHGKQYKNYIILASFCILTGVFADVFLQGLYGKVFNVLEDKIEEQDNEIARVQFTNDALLNVISTSDISTSNDSRYLDYVKENYSLNTDQLKLYQSLTAEPVNSFRTEELTPAMQKHINVLMEKELIKKKDLMGEVLISRSPIEINN